MYISIYYFVHIHNTCGSKYILVYKKYECVNLHIYAYVFILVMCEFNTYKIL